jgi:hypothetical protein
VLLQNTVLICLHNVSAYIGCLTFQWPCGIVVNIAEMFNCESKSQVYGHLNKIMAKENMSAVGKWSS